MKIAQMAIGLLIPMLGVTTAFCDENRYTLQDAYTAALATNESIKIAEEGVVQADSRVDQARTYLFPRLTANAGNTWYNKTLPPGGGDFLFQPREQFHAGLVLTQPLYTGGRTLAAFRTARTLFEMSRKQLTTSQQDMLLNVAAAYFEVLKARKLVEVSRDSLSRMEQYKKVTERVASTRRSKANISDLLRAKTLVSQAAISVVTAQDRLRIARRRLSLLTRLPAEENITIVRGSHYPQISAEGGVRYQDSRPTMIMDETVYYGGIRLQIPIFEGGLMKAEVSEARSKFRQAEYATELLRRNIEMDVYEAYVKLETVTSVLESTRLRYADAKENFDAVTYLFNEGLASSLMVIDAQQALYFTEREFVAATYDKQVAILRLQRSIGLMGKEF